MPVSAFASLLLLLGLGLGLAGDVLLNIRPWGVNVFLWCELIAAGLLATYRATRLKTTPRFWMILSIWLVSAALFSWRDSDTLRAFNVLALTTLTGVLLLEVQPRLSAPFDWVMSLLRRLGEAAWRGFDVLETWVRTRVPGNPEVKARRTRVLRGSLMALPLLVVFGGLLASADTAFQTIVTNAFDWNIDMNSGISHFLGFLASAWVALGLLSAPGAPSLVKKPAPRSDGPVVFDVGNAPAKKEPVRIGMTEISFVLGSLVFLFGAFVAVQMAYLFGGSAHVQQIAGVSYAEYARKGFFELVWVTVLAVPVLLACRQIASREGPLGHRVFLSLGGLMVGLLFVIMASAWTRMGLYVESYGLTTLRLYVLVAMLWIGSVLAWLMATFVRRTPLSFAPGAAALGVFGVFVLNWMNPDGMTAEFNLNRAVRTGNLDSAYLASLSMDAAPAIARSSPKIPAKLQPAVASALRSMAKESDMRDWRSWTWSEHRADSLAVVGLPPE